MFTDRFIKIPIKVYNVKEKELTNNENCYDSYEQINPFEISSYRPSFDSDYTEKECVSISFKNGSQTLAYLSVKEFEKLLNTTTR